MHFAYQDFYAYQVLAKLPDIVRRAIRVRDVFAKRRVPEKVKRRCREAYLTYLYGHHAASVALCRSVVECVLEEIVPKEEGVERLGVYKLGEIARARGIISSHPWEKYERVRTQANRCIHSVSSGREINEAKNLEIIKLTQLVLQELLKGKGGSNDP